MKNENDQRVVKTRESLVNAYLELIIENVSSKVLAICNRANITPITFYHHFGDKNELIKYVVCQQLQHTLPIPEKLKPSGNKQLFIYLVKSITSFFINNKEVVFNSLNNIKDKGYRFSYIDCLTNTIEYETYNEFELLDKTINKDIKEIIVKWFVGGLLFVIYSYISDQRSLNINDIITALKLLAAIIAK